MGHTRSVRSVCFSPDGRFLVGASNDATVCLWDRAAGTACYALAGHTDWIESACFSPDGGLLASASDDRTVRLWDFSARLPMLEPSPRLPE